MARYDRMWERLLSALNSWATATELEPGRIRVQFVDSDGSQRCVDIVMTPDEWDDIASAVWGSVEDAAGWVKGRLLELEPDHRFLVHSICDLIPSQTDHLPVDDSYERVRALQRAHPEHRGRWVVLDDDGNVLDEFR